MAFKKTTPSAPIYNNPYDLFKSLSGRRFPDLMLHQQEMLQTYLEEGLDKRNIALQLPTGSGKTLVGLLLAEWRRRKFNEKIVYLCPTTQLVHQTHQQAREDHKIRTLAFTGSKHKYDPSDKAAYETGKHIAVTTYSSVFNTNSYFNDADIIIVDDAHAAENYIANLWSVEINPLVDKHKSLHTALSLCLQPHISKTDYDRLTGQWNHAADSNWHDKLPTPKLWDARDTILATIHSHIKGTGLEFSWSLLADKLDACHLYLSSNSILIRPLIPPTWSLASFSNPKQRIFMSATLGEGGDLERLTGIPKIHRLPVPTTFQKQGIGRRFFMFPEMSMTPEHADKLRLELMGLAGRSVVITPDKKNRDRISAAVQKHLKIPVYDAIDIETKKAQFSATDNAAAIMANRYDGVDFPNADSRLLCVDGLPRAMNAQEHFIMARMGATILFNERIHTRVLQAIGRCTRSLQDYSAVYVTGQHLQTKLTNIRQTGYFSPEMQAELKFGIEQSMNVDIVCFKENFLTFIEHEEAWEEVNANIVSDTQILDKIPFPALDDLAKIAPDEIAYQQAMWQKDYVSALDAAKKVITNIQKGSDLRGYRGLWFYLAGSAAYLASENGFPNLISVAREQFSYAKRAANLIPWFAELSSLGLEEVEGETSVPEDAIQIERIETLLLGLGNTHDSKFLQFEKIILDGLKDGGDFEKAHEQLGELLGFAAGNVEESGSPDPWWISASKCFVFEDHANAQDTSILTVKKARQASSHPAWMRDNIEEAINKEIFAILVTPVSQVDKGGRPHLKNVYLWPLADFKEWAIKALEIIRSLRATLCGVGDLAWRANSMKLLEDNGLTTQKIINKLQSSIAYDILKPVTVKGEI